jgi:hypothetical protein
VTSRNLGELYLKTHVSIEERGRLVAVGESSMVRDSIVYVITAWNPGDERPTHEQNNAAGRWPSSNAELADWAATGQWTEADQGAHTTDITIPLNGSDTAYTFVWLPHPVRSVPQQLSDSLLIAPSLLHKWRHLASQDSPSGQSKQPSDRNARLT